MNDIAEEDGLEQKGRLGKLLQRRVDDANQDLGLLLSLAYLQDKPGQRCQFDADFRRVQVTLSSEG